MDWEDQILEDTVPLVGFVRMILHSGKCKNVTDRRTRLTPKSIKFCMILKNWMDEEFRLNKLKRLERYRMSEMKEEDQEDEDGEPDLVINAQEDQEPDIERFYFPITDYYYSSTNDPHFTFDWQNYPD
ncbi:uncharacterized protein LOC121762474 [Salvia splendens]|uniref:uncharacterized protein LOC121762474 n=1 Tax=Salvia splendens TaxID=180675 RepID=UPI001C2588EF|nr:uncharacterized protein LOC121762474 [Salvia splendens]